MAKPPDFGDAVTVQADEVPVFWACGVTPTPVTRAISTLLKAGECVRHFIQTQKVDKT